MEKIQQFFRHISERLSNPFLFSFLVGWLIANYKVIIGLCFYSISELQIDGYTSYINLIAESITWRTGFWIPLMAALLYTFIFPFFKTIVTLLYVKINQWQEKKAVEIIKNGSISTNKYLRLRENYKQSQELLSKVIEEESDFFQQRNDLNKQHVTLVSDLAKAKTIIKELESKLGGYTKLQAKTDVRFLEGPWIGIIIPIVTKQTQQVEMHFSVIGSFVEVKVRDSSNRHRVSLNSILRMGGKLYVEFSELDNKIPVLLDPFLVLSISGEDKLKGVGKLGTEYNLTKLSLEEL